MGGSRGGGVGGGLFVIFEPNPANHPPTKQISLQKVREASNGGGKKIFFLGFFFPPKKEKRERVCESMRVRASIRLGMVT